MEERVSDDRSRCDFFFLLVGNTNGFAEEDAKYGEALA